MTDKVLMLAEDVETVINYSKYHLGEWAEVYTTDKVVMKRYEKFSNSHPELCKLIKEDKYGMTWSVDPRCVSLYPRAPRKGPKLSEEHKQINIQRLRGLHKPTTP